MCRILIVEDDPFTRQAVIDLLKMNKYNIKIAESGEEALELIKNEIPDLIITDIMTEEANSFEFIKKINDIDKMRHIPFIFISRKWTLQILEKHCTKGLVCALINRLE